MKKVFTAFAFMALNSQSFAAAEKTVPQSLPFEGKPTIVLQVFDMNGKVARPIEGNTLSISKKQNRLCWASVNVPVEARMTIAEAFYAPSSMKLVSQGSKIDSSAYKKNHTVVTEVNSIENKYISRCWNFDKNDPAGKYQMEVQIGGYVFKGLYFEIEK